MFVDAIKVVFLLRARTKQKKTKSVVVVERNSALSLSLLSHKIVRIYTHARAGICIYISPPPLLVQERAHSIDPGIERERERERERKVSEEIR